MCDWVIGTEKGHMECWVKKGNNAATAEQVCEGLSHMGTLPRNHKSFVLQPAQAELGNDLPLKDGKGSNDKHFTLYHEIEFVYYTVP